MYSSKITVQVKRKKKAGAGMLKGLMIFFGVLFVLMGIMFSRGFMLSGFLLVVLYFVFDTFSKKSGPLDHIVGTSLRLPQMIDPLPEQHLRLDQIQKT